MHQDKQSFLEVQRKLNFWIEQGKQGLIWGWREIVDARSNVIYRHTCEKKIDMNCWGQRAGFDGSIISVKHPCYLVKFCTVPDKCFAAAEHTYKIPRLCTLYRTNSTACAYLQSASSSNAHTQRLRISLQKSLLFSCLTCLVVVWIISKLSHLPLPSRSIDQFQRCDYHVTRSDPRLNPSIFQLFLSHLSIKVSPKTLEPTREWCHEEEEEEEDGNALTRPRISDRSTKANALTSSPRGLPTDDSAIFFIGIEN